VVFIVEEGKALLRKVETGIQDNNYIEITGGLEPDDQVVVAPYSAISRQLRNDMSVEVVPVDELFEGNNRD
jgi:HlyD family secretion protein